MCNLIIINILTVLDKIKQAEAAIRDDRSKTESVQRMVNKQ